MVAGRGQVGRLQAVPGAGAEVQGLDQVLHEADGVADAEGAVPARQARRAQGRTGAKGQSVPAAGVPQLKVSVYKRLRKL